MTSHPTAKLQYKAHELWVKDFEQSRLGKKAIDALKELSSDFTPELQKNLKDEVLRACYYAFLFWHIGDVNSEKRDLLRDLASLDNSLCKKIGDIIREISFFDTIHDTLVMEGAYELLGNDKTLINDEFIPLDALLCHLELYKLGLDRLQNNLPTHDNREECWLHGNMLHPERIDGFNQHPARKAATCLMFQLAVYFRLLTHPKGQKLFDKKKNLNVPESGTTLPKEGKRHDKIIAAFVNATFANEPLAIKLLNLREDKIYHELDSAYSVSSITARLEKIDSCIKLVPWTDASFDLSLVILQSDSKKLSKLTQKIG